MANLHLVAIDELAAEVTVDFVQVQTVITCQQGLHEFNVLAHLVDVACTAGIVTCGLNATAEGIVALKAYHIVGLPAMQRNLLLLKKVQHCVGVDAHGCIAFFRHGISLFN